MKLLISKNRTHTFKREATPDDSAEFSVTFCFKYKEESNLSEIRQKFSGDSAEQIGNVLMYNLRTALISCTGIADRDKPIPGIDGAAETYEDLVITDSNGKVDEAVQKAVFDAVTNYKEILSKVILAYSGTSLKN